jgi:hypoxanthine phosphoribosyltransferase
MLMYSWTDFQQDVRIIAASLRAGCRRHSYIYAVPRGGLVLGVYLSHTLDLPLIESRLFRSDFGTDVLVVDDSTGTGSTLAEYAAMGCTTAVLVHNPVSSCVKPTVYGRESLDWPVFPWEADSGVSL